MRRLLILLLGCLLLLPARADPPAAGPPPTREEVLTALETFRKDPLAPSPNQALATIVQFATNSNQVNLKIGPKVCPWVSEPESKKYSPLLLGAYIAGNVEAQLKAGRSADRPEAGLALVFDVYSQLRAQDSAFRSAGVDKLQELAKSGKLSGYLKSAR